MGAVLFKSMASSAISSPDLRVRALKPTSNSIVMETTSGPRCRSVVLSCGHDIKQVTLPELRGKVDPDWCQGCGDFGVLARIREGAGGVANPAAQCSDD